MKKEGCINNLHSFYRALALAGLFALSFVVTAAAGAVLAATGYLNGVQTAVTAF